MKSWQELIKQENLTDHELKQIPCLHQQVVESISTYFQKKFNMSDSRMMKMFISTAEKEPTKQHWINALDFDHYLGSLFQKAPMVIKPDLFYNIAKTFLTSNISPYKYYLQNMPSRMALLAMEQLGNTCHHAMPVKVAFDADTRFMITIKPYPYYRPITKGTFCHFVRGITDAIFKYRKIRVNEL